MKIQYLEEFEKIDNNMIRNFSAFSRRQNLVQKYAWAIPTEEAINEVAKYSPIVEVGAGTGYWASLIASKGAYIVPFDKNPPARSANEYKHYKEYCDVYEGGPEVLNRFSHHFNLFLCWPPYDNPFAMDCLKNFKGKNLIYIGEDKWGCNATDEFFNELGAKWKHVKSIRIPQWDGIHDSLDIYERK